MTDINKIKKKLIKLKDLFNFQMEIGEDTSVIERKIRELEGLVKNI